MQSLHKEHIERKKARPEVNVLLLGQSESGKSTTLKQFQLLYSPAAFHSERIAWRAVIYLNLPLFSLRPFRRILEALAPELDQLDEHDDLDSGEAETDIVISSNGRPPSAILDTRVANYEDYRRRLAPLIELEERLTHLLAAPDEDDSTHPASARPSWEGVRSHFSSELVNGFTGRPTPTITIPSRMSPHVVRSVSAGGHDSRAKEVAVRSGEWKRAFQRRLGYKSKSPKTPKSGEIEGWWEDPDDPVHTLHSCARAMQELWADPQVRQRLREKRLRLEESSGFYLDEIHRITAKKYIPTDGKSRATLVEIFLSDMSGGASLADVLKARLKTTGVVEHTFVVNVGHNKGTQWRIYDVGGARGQRQAWAPYFDDVNAIIFLAPISAFDQDPRINRLEDSLLLWKSLVSNPLLARVNIILFLNKCDLLQAKLEAGVRLSHHMYTYGDRPNDYESVSKSSHRQDFRNKFGALHMSYSLNKEREPYIHFTAVTDTRKTATIISSVRDIIIRNNLRAMRLEIIHHAVSMADEEPEEVINLSNPHLPSTPPALHTIFIHTYTTTNVPYTTSYPISSLLRVDRHLYTFPLFTFWDLDYHRTTPPSVQKQLYRTLAYIRFLLLLFAKPRFRVLVISFPRPWEHKCGEADNVQESAQDGSHLPSG
ncbi:hypothetical protein D9756_006129 [Leucocoprinus leucothites]|uniref:G-alpha-domain-containing protein n=1 Tax=Leucocoprinus leucothites TaxID=201217 RepID=A0A8H5D4B1_9AGAR|nr:hypothetical protein D9756_006129 [Leucoagaricus leucothites]